MQVLYIQFSTYNLCFTFGLAILLILSFVYACKYTFYIFIYWHVEGKQHNWIYLTVTLPCFLSPVFLVILIWILRMLFVAVHTSKLCYAVRMCVSLSLQLTFSCCIDILKRHTSTLHVMGCDWVNGDVRKCSFFKQTLILRRVFQWFPQKVT
jgi:membrane-associated phospholipid phosphatase